MPPLRLGTRGSDLARWQAQWVAARLTERGVAVALVPILTQGDEQQAGPVGSLGAQGVFTKEIQRALLDGRVDLAVHSLKDLPTEPVPGLALAAVPKRESVCDAILSRSGVNFGELPTGAVIGTGSQRRRSQLLHLRGDLEVRDIRGNVDTRIRKLDDGEFDAILLAEAGLKRLGLAGRITQVLPPTIMLPAIGQGALGIEARDDDSPTRDALAALNDAETWAAVLAERALLHELRGGCLAPVGAWGRIKQGELRLDAAVLSADGTRRVASFATGSPDEAEELGRQVARLLADQGATELIAAARV